MLRAVVAVLLLANLAFWAWSEGLLEPVGLVPTHERDPQRLNLQINPDAVQVLAPAAASAALRAAEAAARAPAAVARPVVQCLDAGPFSASAIDAAERAMAAASLPAGSWARTRHEAAPQYAVVLGPFGNREALQKKSDELGRLNLPVEALDLPGDGPGAAPQPGFALGRYATRSAADAALVGLGQRGVRTARVTQLKPSSIDSRLRVEHATPALVERLRALNSAALGAGFGPCAAAAPASR